MRTSCSASKWWCSLPLLKKWMTIKARKCTKWSPPSGCCRLACRRNWRRCAWSLPIQKWGQFLVSTAPEARALTAWWLPIATANPYPWLAIRYCSLSSRTSVLISRIPAIPTAHLIKASSSLTCRYLSTPSRLLPPFKKPIAWNPSLLSCKKTRRTSTPTRSRWSSPITIKC